MRCESRLEVMAMTHQCDLERGHAGEHRHGLRRCTLCWENDVALDRVTPDDSVFCRICEPPYETSIAMFPTHLATVHSWTPEQLVALADAEIVDLTGPEDEAA